MRKCRNAGAATTTRSNTPLMTTSISIIVPVYNEEDGLAALFARLYPALDALGETYEIIFINDGSRDRSDRKSTRLNSSHPRLSRMPSSA